MSTYSQNTDVMSIKCVRMCACKSDSCSNKLSLRHVPVLDRGKKSTVCGYRFFLFDCKRKQINCKSSIITITIHGYPY